jgi:hypothetical protein
MAPSMYWRDYGLDGRGIVARFPAGAKGLSFLQRFKIGHGFHQSSYLMRTGGPLLGENPARCEADHSLLTSAKVKNEWIYATMPPYALWCAGGEL